MLLNTDQNIMQLDTGLNKWCLVEHYDIAKRVPYHKFFLYADAILFMLGGLVDYVCVTTVSAYDVKSKRFE